MHSAAEIISFDPNPTTAKKAWPSSSCLLYDSPPPPSLLNVFENGRTTKTWLRLTILQQCLSNLLGDNLQTASTTLLIFMLFSIEYWMVYREPGFLAVVWFGSPLRQLLVPNSQSSCLSQVELTDGKGCVRSQTYDGEKAWSFINHKSFNTTYLLFSFCHW